MDTDGEILEYKLPLQRYTKTLLSLLRVCTGMTYDLAARHCGISRPLLSQWTSGVRPMPPHHERALRQRLTQGIARMRDALPAMPRLALDALQVELIKALVDLEGAVIAMEKAYAASVGRHTAGARRAREALPAATAPVHTLADEAERQAYTAHAALPGVWRAIAQRNRTLRARLDPDAMADVHSTILALLDFADMAYGLPDGEAIEVKGPRHRRRGRPRKHAGPRATR